MVRRREHVLLDLPNDLLLVICLRFLPCLIDIIHVGRCNKKLWKELDKPIVQVRDRPREAAMALKVSHLKETVDISSPDRIALYKDHLQNYVAFNRVLKHLNLEPLGREGAKLAPAIAESLKTNESLKELNMASCGLNAEDSKGLAGSLAVHASLTELQIGRNCIGDKGVEAICNAVKANKDTKLATLDIRNNDVTPAGAKHVAAMLAVTASLTSLSLAANQLCGLDDEGIGTYDAAGIIAIADALRVNASLTQLNISCNALCGIDEYGHGTFDVTSIKTIADALRSNASLTELDVSCNNLTGTVGEAALREAVQDKEGFNLSPWTYQG